MDIEQGNNMNDTALDMARELYRRACLIHAAVMDEMHGSSIPTRVLDAPVSGGGKSDPTASRALRGLSERDSDPEQFGAIGGNRTLAFTIPRLRELLDNSARILDMLDPSDAVDIDGVPTGEKSCRVCNCCRAVEPRHRPTRCGSCEMFRRRENRDRNHEEVNEHQEREWARERDRAEQRRYSQTPS